jgi:hypothetical protein
MGRPTNEKVERTGTQETRGTQKHRRTQGKNLRLIRDKEKGYDIGEQGRTGAPLDNRRQDGDFHPQIYIYIYIYFPSQLGFSGGGLVGSNPTLPEESQEHTHHKRM